MLDEWRSMEGTLESIEEEEDKIKIHLDTGTFECEKGSKEAEILKKSLTGREQKIGIMRTSFEDKPIVVKEVYD